MMLAICTRGAFEALVMIVNSTASPASSCRVPSFQENPARPSRSRAPDSERAGGGSVPFIQSLLPGVTCVARGVPRPW